MARRKTPKARRGSSSSTGTKQVPVRQQLALLNQGFRELVTQVAWLKGLVREGLLTAEMLRVQSEGDDKARNYEALRREALRALVTRDEEFTDKLGLRVDARAAFADKYAVGASTAMCEELTHVCGAACCRERFPLTPQDIAEGAVEFDLDDPYTIKLGPRGHCVHCDPESMRCKIWEQRPARCRLYTCRWDAGVWKDYVRRIPSDNVAELSSKQEESSDKDASTATVKGKPGIVLDPSTFHVFECDGDRLMYDVSRGQVLHVAPVAFDILLDNGSVRAPACIVAFVL